MHLRLTLFVALFGLCVSISQANAGEAVGGLAITISDPMSNATDTQDCQVVGDLCKCIFGVTLFGDIDISSDYVTIDHIEWSQDEFPPMWRTVQMETGILTLNKSAVPWPEPGKELILSQDTNQTFRFEIPIFDDEMLDCPDSDSHVFDLQITATLDEDVAGKPGVQQQATWHVNVFHDCLAKKGDSNQDGMINIFDYFPLADCVEGPQVEPIDPNCVDTFDFNGDNHIDLFDLGEFQRHFGEGLP